MVYESDFYTTRRPYRVTPSVSSYTHSTIVPSRQIRIVPGLGKVYVVHSYERLIPYIGHKRLTVVSPPPHIIRVRPSVIIREIDRIAHKARPYIYYSPTSSYLNSEPITFFDDETRLIRAQTASLLRKIHAPVPRVRVPWPLTKVRYHYELPLPSRITSDDYIYRMLTPITLPKSDIYNISHYYNEPLKRYIGPSHLACVRYGGDKAYSRRRNLTLQEIYAMQSDAVRNDIQLLSYYIRANKQRKALEGDYKAPALDAARPTRIFSKPQLALEPNNEIKELREQRAERLRKIYEDDKTIHVENAGENIKRSTKKQEEERLAEERALIEEKAKRKEQAKREEEARRAELARQEELAAQAAAERQAELERKAELARQAEEDERRQEEERQQLLRLEELARQAEEEKERELARQAEELAELARQEAELAELERKEAELAELERKEAELAELAKREEELAELERQEKELAELDRQERELAELAKQEAELAELERQNQELTAAESSLPAEAETSDVENDDEAIASEPEQAAEPDLTESEHEAEPEPEAEDAFDEPVVEEPRTPEVGTMEFTEEGPKEEEPIEEDDEEEDEEEE